MRVYGETQAETLRRRAGKGVDYLQNNGHRFHYSPWGLNPLPVAFGRGSLCSMPTSNDMLCLDLSIGKVGRIPFAASSG